MAFAVRKEPEAFSMSPIDRKRKAKKEPDYLAWIRELPCLVTGVRPVEAAHIRYADPRYGKRETGGGEKSDDRWAIPLCRTQHALQHSMDERVYWASTGIDPVQVASALYGVRGDNTLAELIIKQARSR